MFVAFPPDVWYLIASRLSLHDIGSLLRTCRWIFSLNDNFEFWATIADEKRPGGNDVRAYNEIRLHGNIDAHTPLSPSLAYRAAFFWEELPYLVEACVAEKLPTKATVDAMSCNDMREQTLYRELVESEWTHVREITVGIEWGRGSLRFRFACFVHASFVDRDSGNWMLSLCIHLPREKFYINRYEFVDWNISITPAYYIVPTFAMDMGKKYISGFELAKRSSLLSDKIRVTNARHVMDVHLLETFEDIARAES